MVPRKGARTTIANGSAALPPNSAMGSLHEVHRPRDNENSPPTPVVRSYSKSPSTFNCHLQTQHPAMYGFSVFENLEANARQWEQWQLYFMDGSVRRPILTFPQLQHPWYFMASRNGTSKLSSSVVTHFFEAASAGILKNTSFICSSYWIIKCKTGVLDWT